MNPIFHHLASITTKLTSQSHRLSQTRDYATSMWWTIEFRVKIFLTCIRSFSSCYVLIRGGRREGGRGKIREKKRERVIPSRGTPSKPHVNLHTSQRPYFLIPSHWESKWTQFNPQQLCRSVFKSRQTLISFTVLLLIRFS